MPSSPKPASRRKNIGVFASQVGRAWGAEFIAGITAAAEANNVNVVHFIGGKLTPQTSPDKNKPSFGLYDLVRSEQFDGLIITADAAYGTSAEELQVFTSVYGDLAMVTQSVPVQGAVMFIPDNTEGMRSAVRHLIEEHGYKRIAFICGIKGQMDAEQRFQAYKDELSAHGLRYDEDLVIDGDYSLESGRNAIEALLDERKLRFQAVVAANDRMAFGALEALQQRGLRVPEDVAVTGFDDLREAQAMGVPLTTVRQSFYTAGKNALETLLKKINGDTLPRITITPTQLLVRWSCGCLPENVRKAAVLPRDVARTGRLENKREAALRALLNAAGITEQDPLLPQFKDTFGRAWDGFLLALNDRISAEEFLKMMNVMIQLMQKQDLLVSVWHNVISMMRRYALGGITSHTMMLKAENLFQQARLLAGELSQRAQAYRRLMFEQQEHILQAFSFSMAPAMTLDDIGRAISEHFPRMGINRWYVMFYSDVASPQSIASPAPDSYRLLFQYEDSQFDIPRKESLIGTGQLIPRGKTPEDHRYTAVVMPLILAKNRFGFMWVEMGPRDWEVYVRIRNLVSSALLRTMLVAQKEQAQTEVERLLSQARDHTVELAIAKEFAERTALENARLYSSEQARRHAAEALAKASRQISSLSAITEVPQQIVSQLSQIVPNERCALFLEDVNGFARLRGHKGFPSDAPMDDLNYSVKGISFYHSIVQQTEALVIGDTQNMQSWEQPQWHPEDRSWLGVPIFSKNKVAGMLTLTRSEPGAFNQDDILLASTFAIQASIALENARLYDDLNRFNQMMERMVEQRVNELSVAHNTLKKLDKNKSDFIQVAAHELRTPLTVIKGYISIIKASPAIKDNTMLLQSLDGVLQGTDRLQQIVGSMLDVARLDSEVLKPNLQVVPLGPLVRLIQKDYTEDLKARQLTLEIDPAIDAAPPLLADMELIKKALDNVIVNAIKFTPDGGRVVVTAERMNGKEGGEYCQISVKDTGIGIDPTNHTIIFEKLYQIGKVELHSSGRTKFKGGGPGLGLAIAAGIIKAHQGKIWAESPGHDEQKLPGSTFLIQIPIAK
jgi:DNA-binding LacI/PurR family transcriptional regulator/signal transduction histidine kinase